MAEKERLYFATHRHGNAVAKANGVTFEAGVPAEHEVYFAITDSTEFRAPTMSLTHHGGVDIEELDKTQIARVPFEALTGLKAFVVANALTDIGAPKEIISPLVQHLPKLWELVHHYGMTTLELNPIRMRPARDGRLTPVACDFKCGFDRDDPRWQRLELPDHLFAADTSEFEQEINQLRTHQGQSDVFVINDKGTILAPTFGGGANSLVTEVLGEAAIISSDFGGNPPYKKMKAVAGFATSTGSSKPMCCSSSAVSRTTPTSMKHFARWAMRCASISVSHGADTALCCGRTRRTESGARHGLAGRDLRLPWHTVPLFRLRQRDFRGRQLRQEGRRMDARLTAAPRSPRALA